MTACSLRSYSSEEGEESPFFEPSSVDRVSCTIRHGLEHVRTWLLREWCAWCRGEHKRSIRMNWVRTIAGVLVLWCSPAWGATLTWNANTETDFAGYRVYQCSQEPCTRSSSNAALLATLGMVTTFNVGTPTITQYYFITAYDLANNESGSSNIVTFTPLGSLPPAPTNLRVLSAQ